MAVMFGKVDMVMDAQAARRDPEARRAEVVAATCRVIARDGLDRASMRAIAQELGSTTGVLTHYFRDKEQMLTVVLAEIVAATYALHQQRLAGAFEVDDLVDYLCEMLPNSPAQIEWWKVWLAFTAASMGAGRESRTHAQFYDRLRRGWVADFRRLIAGGQMRADVDVALEADVLLGLIDGLGVQILIAPAHLTPPRQRQIFTEFFQRLAPGQSRSGGAISAHQGGGTDD